MDTATAPVATIGHNNPPPLREILAERFAPLSREIEQLAERANEAPKEIANEEQYGAVGDIAVEARKLTKSIDEKRKAEKEPYLQGGRDVDAFFGILLDRVKRIADTLQARADTYARQKAAEERRKREEEARRQQAEEQRQREIAAKEAERNRPTAAAKHEDKAEAAAERVAEAQAAASVKAAELTRTRSATGTVASARTTWDFEITDINAVPLDTLRPFIKREHIEQAIRSFVRINKDSAQLAGVKIFESTKANFR